MLIKVIRNIDLKMNDKNYSEGDILEVEILENISTSHYAHYYRDNEGRKIDWIPREYTEIVEK